MNALGNVFCARLGCTRRRHVSADGRIRYAECLAHALERLHIFG